MSDSDNLVNTYFRFVSLDAAAKVSSNLPALDATEHQLLNQIALAARTGTPLSVSDAMRLDGIGSPMTLHNRLKSLRQKEMLDVEFRENFRKKLLVPTKMANTYFAALGKAITDAAAQTE